MQEKLEKVISSIVANLKRAKKNQFAIWIPSGNVCVGKSNSIQKNLYFYL